MNKYFDKFNTYFRIASKISSFRNSDQHLQNILKEIMDVGGIQRGMVLLSDDSGEYLLLKAHHGISANLLGVLQKSRIDETSMIAQVFSTAESFVAKCSDKIDAPFKSLTKPGEPCFFVCCPIKTSRNVLGLMVLHSRDFEDTFIKNDLVPLEAICRILGETIENCFENSKTIHTEKELKLLHNINAALNSAAGLTEVLDTITEGMVKVFGYTGSLVFLDKKGDGTTITLKSLAYDYKPGIVRKIESLLGFSLKGHVFEPEKENTIHLLFHEQLPYITNNISRQLEELFQSKTLKKLTPAIARIIPVRSALTIPLVMGKKVKGLLVVASRQELNEYDVSQVQAFATQASLAIETARHYR
ncbi:MAG: GAF domain-containing protein, partial [Spirochaetales bacterium]|nr:GAF domain-containing protein [Spirochaetales bacterium]